MAIVTAETNEEIKRYFEVLVPALAKNKRAAFARMTGRIAIIVKDCGHWTIQLGNLNAPVLDTADPNSDLALSFAHSAFTDFLGGKLDIDQALERGDIAFDGDVQLLENFGLLMQNVQDLVSIRERN